MRPRSVFSLLLTPLLALSCASGEDASSLVLSLDLAVNQSALELDPDAQLRDDLDLFDLPAVTVYVSLEVTAADMDPVAAEWPATATDLQNFDGTAVVELEVPPGEARALDGVVFAWSEDSARVYAPSAPISMDLAAGAVEDVDLALVEADYGTISGTAPEEAVAVEIVDQMTDVILTRVTPGDDGSFEASDLPAHRPLYPVWNLGDAGRTPAPDLATHIPEAGGGATFPDPI